MQWIAVYTVVFLAVVGGNPVSVKTLDNPCGGAVVAGPDGVGREQPVNGLRQLIVNLESSIAEATKLFNHMKKTALNPESLMELRDSEIEVPSTFSRTSVTAKRHAVMGGARVLAEIRRVDGALVDMYERAARYTARIKRMSHGGDLEVLAWGQMCCLKQVLIHEGLWGQVSLPLIEENPPTEVSTLQQMVDLAFYRKEFLPSLIQVAESAQILYRLRRSA